MEQKNRRKRKLCCIAGVLIATRNAGVFTRIRGFAGHAQGTLESDLMKFMTMQEFKEEMKEQASDIEQNLVDIVAYWKKHWDYALFIGVWFAITYGATLYGVRFNILNAAPKAVIIGIVLAMMLKIVSGRDKHGG